VRKLGPVDLFVAGAVGEPGDRTFLIQVVQSESRLSYLLEKGQVEALGEQAQELLENVGLAGAGSDLPTNEPWYPEELEFRIGAMQLGYEEATGIIAIVLIPTDSGDEHVSYDLTPAQLGAAARDGLAAVGSGRPKCPSCGLAMDPTGHHCPATNGDLRGYRP
jgi:uncharacterized repeat protein (TIGR03847 family)